jgi:HAE1 family hydrophobic/amphiphilic exporter-1
MTDRGRATKLASACRVVVFCTAASFHAAALAPGVVPASAPPALQSTPQSTPQSPPQPTPQALAPLPLSLEEALRRALERNLDLAIDEANLEARRARAGGAWGAFDPTYSLRAALLDRQQEAPSSLTGADVLEENTQTFQGSLGLPLQTGGRFDLSFNTDNQETNSQFSLAEVATTDVVRLAYTQPLLRGAWRGYATSEQRLAELELAQARERRAVLRAEIALSVRRAYWDLVAAREQVAVADLAQRLAGEQVQQNQRRLDVGVGTEVDVLQARTTLAQREEQLLSARTAVANAEDALRVLVLGRAQGEAWQQALASWNVPLEPTTPLYDPATQATPPVGEVLASAFGQRAELAEQRLLIESAEVRLSRAVSELRPALDASLSATSVGFDGDPGEAFDKSIGFEFPALEAALTLSGPLRNRTARGNARAGRAELRAALLGYDKVELAILTEVRSAVRELAHQAEAVAAAERSVDLARRQLEAEQARHAQGLSTTFQLLDFQQQLAAALGSRTSALAGYARAQAQLARARGA